MIDWQAEARALDLRRADGTEYEAARRAKARDELNRETLTIEDLYRELANVQRNIRIKKI